LFLLSATKHVSPYWLTMKQANQLGGAVRKGERSQIAVFWKVDQVSTAHGDAAPEELAAAEKGRRRFVLKYYRIFNLEQCELPPAVLDKQPKIETRQHDPIEAAERIIAAMPNPPEIRYAGGKAFYSPLADRIALPPRELFASAEELYATAFHELGHYAESRIMPRSHTLTLSGRALPARHIGIIPLLGTCRSDKARWISIPIRSHVLLSG
jgi:antirestriction protein ArdC